MLIRMGYAVRALAVTVPILYQWQTKVRAITNAWKPHPITVGLGEVVHGGYIFDVLMYCSETREFVIRKGKFRKAKEDFKIYYEDRESPETMYPICVDFNSKSE